MEESSPEFRAVRPDEWEEVLNLWITVFGSEDRAYFHAFLEGDPWRKERYCQVARVEGRIVSVAYLCRRPMRYRGEVIFLGRIEAVATLPGYRRRGLSTELLRRIVEVMEAEDFAFSSLNTGNHSHYNKHGFYRIPLPKNALTLDVTLPIPDVDPDVQPLSLEEWLEESPPVFAAFNATLPLCFERAAAYWNSWLRIRMGAMKNNSLLLLGLRRQGILEGYLLGELPQTSGERVSVHEIAALEPEGRDRLFAGAVRAARSVEATGVFGPHHALMKPTMQSFGALKVGEGGVMHRRIHATEAAMQEIDHGYESGSAIWWNYLDGY